MIMMMMEFLQEFLLPAFISIVFSFFLAKLISLASSPDLDQDLAQTLISAVDPSQPLLRSERVRVQSIHELKFGGQEAAIVRREICGGEPLKDCERGIGFGGALDPDRIGMKEGPGEGDGADFLKSGGLDGKQAEDEKKSGRDGGFDVGLAEDGFEAKEDAKSDGDVEFDVGLAEQASRSNLNEFEAMEGERIGGDDEIDVEAVKEASEGEKRFEIDGEFDLGLAEEEVKLSKEGLDVADFAPPNVGDEGIAVEKGNLLDDEDEWEGIERSELDERFAAVALRVALGGGDLLSKIGSDVAMQLYGLHKVATEGPCYEPQPSMLKVSARAKWY